MADPRGVDVLPLGAPGRVRACGAGRVGWWGLVVPGRRPGPAATGSCLIRAGDAGSAPGVERSGQRDRDGGWLGGQAAMVGAHPHAAHSVRAVAGPAITG